MKISKQNLPDIAAKFVALDKADRIFFDDDLPGFGIRFRKGSNRQVYVVQYERNGEQRRLTLGTTALLDPDEARKLARRELAKVTLGHDPQGDKAAAKEKAKITLLAIAQRFLDMKQTTLRPGTLQEYQRYLLKNWKPLHAFPIHRIERRNVAAVLGDLLAKNGPVIAARARSTLISLFAWAVREGYLDVNPAAGTNNPDTHVKRDRTLTDQELVQVWSACRDDDHGRIVKLLILTGQRMREVGGLSWSELDAETGKWQLPAARAKNKREHQLTLPGMAWAIIEQVRDRRPMTDRLFGARGNGFTNWDEAKKGLDQRCPMAHWTLHDLRRTVATRMADLEIATPHVIEAMLNHVSGHKAGVAGIYNRSSYEREVRNALALWAEHIQEITQGGARKVVPLKPISA
jgi:integrase